MVRQPRCHADELGSRAQQGTRPMGIERLHMHRPIPSRAHDLRQSLSIVLIGLVDLHFEHSPRMPRVKACDRETTAAQLMHQPWRHRTGLDTDAGILAAMPPDRTLDLIRIRGALAAPQSATRIVHDTDRRQFLRDVQTDKAGHLTLSYGQSHRTTSARSAALSASPSVAAITRCPQMKSGVR